MALLSKLKKECREDRAWARSFMKNKYSDSKLPILAEHFGQFVKKKKKFYEYQNSKFVTDTTNSQTCLCQFARNMAIRENSRKKILLPTATNENVKFFTTFLFLVRKKESRTNGASLTPQRGYCNSGIRKCCSYDMARKGRVRTRRTRVK